MKLPDFLEFTPFNNLKERMQVTKLGHFELFDPVHHLTGVERSDLDRFGIMVPLSDIHHLLDFTLVFKNSRIWLEDGLVYHLAQCDELKKSQQSFKIGTSERALTSGTSVCPACLQKLQYKGYDAHKARKENYSRQVLERFTLTAYWRQYHQYPVSEKREMRKSLV